MTKSKKTQLGDVVKLNPKCTIEVKPDDLVTFLGMSDVSEDSRITTRACRRFSEVTKGYTQFQEGDILVAKITPCFENGKGALAAGLTNQRGAGSTEFHVLRPSKSIDGRFLHLITRTPHFRLLGEAHMEGSAGQKRVPEAFLRDYPVCLPTIEGQQKIANILGTWDEALEKLDALIAAKARRKQALMQQLLTGELQLRSFKSHPWKSLRMSDLLERVFRPAQIDENASLPLVSIRRRLGGLFRRPDVMPAEYKTQDLHVLKAGDFLISKRQVAHGAWSIVEQEFDGTLVSKEYAILVNRAPNKLDMRFFAWLAQTPRMVRLSRVASTGVHIEKLIFDPDVFLREKIRVPTDVTEQRAIAAVLDTADAELRLLRQQRTALDQQKRGLMQQLLTGKIRTTF